MTETIPCPYCGDPMENVRRKQCGKPDCNRAYKAEYMRGYKTNPDPIRRCSLDECGRITAARGLCAMHWKREYGKRRRVSVDCATCGEQIEKEPDRRRPNQFCSWACRADFQWGSDRPGRIGTELIHVGPAPETCKIPDGHPCRSVIPAPRSWISGPCAWCGTQFTIVGQAMARYCSARCGKQNYERRHGRRFKISPIIRRAIYERDEWMCQICMDPVDPALPSADPWSASLDHVECQSWTLVPDHSASNLRLAHRWCNSVRGDETYYTAEDLRLSLVG